MSGFTPEMRAKAAATRAANKAAREARAAKKAEQPSPKPTTDLAGLTVTDCPKACNAERCVISGIGICGHPRKGGLQASAMKPGAIERMQQAQKMLGKT